MVYTAVNMYEHYAARRGTLHGIWYTVCGARSSWNIVSSNSIILRGTPTLYAPRVVDLRLVSRTWFEGCRKTAQNVLKNIAFLILHEVPDIMFKRNVNVFYLTRPNEFVKCSFFFFIL